MGDSNDSKGMTGYSGIPGNSNINLCRHLIASFVASCVHASAVVMAMAKGMMLSGCLSVLLSVHPSHSRECDISSALKEFFTFATSVYLDSTMNSLDVSGKRSL